MSTSSIGERAAELLHRLEGEAHLWLMGLDNWRPALAEPLLNDEESLRARKLRHPDAQKNFMAGRALIRSTLSRYADVEPASWTFRSTRLGRPEIATPQSRLRFNLAHTPGLAACVVTSDAACGVDVEWLERPLRPLRIAKHSFAPQEFKDLATRQGAELRGRFFDYWTLKEAYYKARGSGIPFRLTGARFSLEGEAGIRFEPASSEKTHAREWQFGLWRPLASHVLAVAVQTGGASHLDVRCFRSAESEVEEVQLVCDRSTERAGR